MADIRETHKKLYHYTNWEGVSGILKSNTLWATHYMFLNDASEFRLFRDRLISLLIPAVEDEYRELGKQGPNVGPRDGHARDPSSFAKDFVDILINDYYRVTDEEVYITSFCGEDEGDPYTQDNGLLSQWRAYGVGGGFALRFDTRKLWHLIEAETKTFSHDGMHLSTCVYSHDEDTLTGEFLEHIATLSESARCFAREALSRKVNQQDQTELYRKSLWPFLFCCSRYKHRGFKEENEVRLVVAPAPLRAVKDGVTSHARRFRYKNGECIPYVSLFDSSGIASAVERIIVGPHKEKTARAAALRVMLGTTQIEVTCSDIPLVG